MRKAHLQLQGMPFWRVGPLASCQSGKWPKMKTREGADEAWTATVLWPPLKLLCLDELHTRFLRAFAPGT